jgi:hypothetical protein
METYRFLIPSNLVPSLKKAARTMDVDVISAKPEGATYLIELMAHNPFDLISIGRIMSMDEAILMFNDPSQE